MAFVPVAKIEDLRDIHAVRVGERELVLCRVEGEVFALDGVCPHVGGPLAHGTLHGRTLACPWHGWEFDCATGEHDRNSACRIATYPVAVRDGEVWVDLA